MDTLTPQDVQATLDTFNLGIQIRYFEQSTATSQLAAEAIGCELGQIAKSICFFVEEKPILVVASGDQYVDDKKIALLFDVGRKKVKLAKADECIAVYGYAPGGVPPIGHRTPNIHTVLDDQLRRYRTIYAAAGTANTIFPLTIEQLPLVTGGTFADVKKDAPVEN